MKTIASRTNSNPHQPLGEFVAGDFVMKRIGLAVAMLVFGFVARGFSQRSGGPGLNLPFRGLGAADNGRSYGSCGMSEVSFGVNQNTTHTDGKPFTSDSGYFSWYPADWCSGSYTYSAGTAIAGGYGGGFHGTVTASNTMFAGNTVIGSQADCHGTIVSGGYNLVQATSGCAITGTLTGNITGIDPRLGLLGYNGGATQSRALLANSPAIDAGNPAAPGSGNGACAVTDQRGTARPQGVRCDIGAFELSGGFVVYGMLPNHGGNVGPLIALIYGNGISKGAAAKLVRSGQADLVGAPVSIDETGSVLSASFNLTGASTGAWDLVITYPDGTSATRAGVFTIELVVASEG